MKLLPTSLAALSLFVVVTACGDSSETTEVHVTTAEVEGGQTITSDVTTFQTGVPYHFVIDNAGSLAHEVMIIEPIEPGTMDMESMDEMAMYVVEEDELEPGATYEFDFTFPADAAGQPLEFACHIEGHYEAGMHLPITVES